MQINSTAFYLIFFFCLLQWSCGTSETDPPIVVVTPDPVEQDLIEGVDFFLPNIDLNNWKVTLPIGDPSEVEPPAILSYATNDALQKYMYNDSIDGALVFYTEPGSTTTNSKYSRTELREQLVPGSNKVNWTYGDGGSLKGALKVSRVSGVEGKLDRIIVMQIHGRLTDEQRDIIGKSDNNAPPVLKIYWDDGKIDVRRKVLKNVDVSDVDILRTDAWTDESHIFDTMVGIDLFTLEIIVKGNSMKVILNEVEEFEFNDVHVEKWAIFDNYFKAGNYLQSTDSDSYSEVRYYELEVAH